MWFEFDSEAGVLRFTHTTKRAKYRNTSAATLRAGGHVPE